MFTGIVTGVGSIATTAPAGDNLRLRIAAPQFNLDDGTVGESIAVSGACLTVVEFTDDGFAVDVSPESLACTTLGALEPGSSVNLERALELNARLGGHLVTGHVDGVAIISELERSRDGARIRITVPEALGRYISRKGSICVDGVSLTVNEVQGASFRVQIIPHTLSITTLGDYHVGQRCNIEVDLLARYLERLMSNDGEGSESGIDMALLQRTGFVK